MDILNISEISYIAREHRKFYDLKNFSDYRIIHKQASVFK